ncbi:MAG: hypothetical protein AAF412_15395, partial [Pseudomonadota bacterium]
VNIMASKFQITKVRNNTKHPIWLATGANVSPQSTLPSPDVVPFEVPFSETEDYELPSPIDFDALFSAKCVRVSNFKNSLSVYVSLYLEEEPVEGSDLPPAMGCYFSARGGSIPPNKTFLKSSSSFDCSECPGSFVYFLRISLSIARASDGGGLLVIGVVDLGGDHNK